MVSVTMALAALLAVTLLSTGGSDGTHEQVAGTVAIAGMTPAAAAACDETTLREAITESEAISPDIVYVVTYLKCAEGYGWAQITSEGEGVIVFLTISDAGMTLIDLGSGICAPEAGIPADIAAQIAPPGEDPTGGCPVEGPTPIETEARFTG